MKKEDIGKLKKKTTPLDEFLTKEHGAKGTESRERFEEEAIVFYYAEILRNRRKELKMTQKELAEKVGKKRSYIARIEKGMDDIRISSYFKIANALGISLSF